MAVRDYELGIVVSPEASEEQTRAIVDRIGQVVQMNGGQVNRVNAWGRRRLAYPIQRHRDGFYYFFDLSLTPQSVLEIDRTLKVTEEVIRHLIVKRDPKAIAAERARQAQAEATAQPAGEVEPESVTAEAGEAPQAEADAEEVIPVSPEELESAPAADETEEAQEHADEGEA